MKKLLSVPITSLFFATSILSTSALSDSQDRSVSAGLQDRFIGAWRLVWLEEPDAEGKVHRAESSGMLVYTRDGHMSVQVMYRNPQTGGQAGPAQYAHGGYEASFGRYAVDERAHSFTFHVEGAIVRSLIGKELPRVYEFSGKQLIVKSSNPNEHWRVAWEHY